ncbi:MAG: sigma 54-interacting transcriptional regulator [Pseudomonadota bacterium]
MKETILPSWVSAHAPLWDGLPAGLFILTANGLIVYANQAAARLWQLAPAELSGQSLESLEPGAWREVARVFQTGAPVLATRLHLGGRQVAAHHFPIWDEGVVTLAASYLLEGFAERPRSLSPEPHQEVTAQLEVIMESSFDGLWICDRRGVVARVNQAALNLVGLPREEVEGCHVDELLRGGNFQQSVTLGVLEHQTTVTMMQHLKSGKKVLATGVPIFDAEGEVAYVVINDRDMTLLDGLRREVERSQAQLEHYRKELSRQRLQELDGQHFLCQSRAMRAVYEQALRVAPTNSTVLITGESGVGKGLLARFIHQASRRAQGPFIRVDCAAIPDTLFESEMFGYAKGAFTGADAKGKLGLVELAQGGTLFLDEISEISPEAQVKLLRFLDERRFVPVGGSGEKELDTRVLAGTNQDLAQAVQEKRFRQDLFYRFKVVPLHIPPLRERPRDVLELSRFFLQRIGEENNIHKQLGQAAQAAVLRYSFPGNVRELENLVERVLIMSRGQEISLEDLPPEVRQVSASSPGVIAAADVNLRQRMQALEGEIIKESLKRHGSQRRAARHLGISQATLARKLRRAFPLMQ